MMKPEIHQLSTTERCNTCLAPVQTGLTLAKWDFGKNHHLTCAYRVGECPECGAKYDKVTLDLDKFIIPQEKEIIEEFKEIEPLEPDDTVEKKISNEEALNILKKRVVKGEIDIDTYRELKKEIE